MLFLPSVIFCLSLERHPFNFFFSNIVFFFFFGETGEKAKPSRRPSALLVEVVVVLPIFSLHPLESGCQQQV